MDDEIEAYLASALAEARLSPAILFRLAERLGWPSALAWIDEQRLPRGIKGRRGALGEVLIGRILQAFLGYSIPVWKDRTLLTGSQSLPALDGLAIRLKGAQIEEVCYYEVKLRTVHDLHAAVAGYIQIEEELRQHFPNIAFFVLGRLEERGDPLLDAFWEYLAEREHTNVRETSRLGLVWDAGCWSEKVLENLEKQIGTSGSSTLEVSLVRLAGLAPLTERIFARFGIESLVDDD